MKKQFVIDDEIIDVDILEENPSFVLFQFNGEEYSVNLGGIHDGKMILSSNGKNQSVIFKDKYFSVQGRDFVIDYPRKGRSKSKTNDHGQMISPMPGKILKIMVKVGDEIEAGTPILVMEAMKMEHTIKASKKGKIESILFKEGDQVSGGVELVKLC